MESEEFIRDAVRESGTRREIIERLGWPLDANSYKKLLFRIRKYRIDISHLRREVPKNNGQPTYELSSILIENSPYQNRTRLKQRLVSEGVLPYICNRCRNDGSWLGTPLTLQLEHKNGIANDNRLENLEFLCPNCHSQTATYAGRNQIRK